MIITNVHNLPQQFVDLATIEYKYQPNEYRATSLLRGLKETILLRRHSDEITVDVADMVWMLFGTAVHNLLESKKETEHELKEERLKVQIGDYLLSGQFDLYCSLEQMVTDYKTTSVWKVIKKNFTDWYMQSLIYALMLEDHGFPVKRSRVVAFLKDHSRSESYKSKKYPQLPVHTEYFDIPVDAKTFIKNWLFDRFELISQYEQLDDDNIPVCTPEERWVADWAVMKKGAKKATRKFDTEGECWNWIGENVRDEDLSFYNVISRGDKKCQEYCYVNSFCNYYKEVYDNGKRNVEPVSEACRIKKTCGVSG